MSVSDITNKASYAGNGVTTDFTFDYKIFGVEQVEVIEVDDVTLVETVKALTNDYTVVLDASEGGTVTMVTAPTSGKTLWLLKNIPLTQPDTVDVGPLPGQPYEQVADRVTLLSQQLKAIIDRTPQFKKTTLSLAPVMPEPVANSYLYWDGSGNLQNGALVTTDATVLDEDNFASDSATGVPSQQSTKAYITAQLAALEAKLIPVTKATGATLLASGENMVVTNPDSAGFTLVLPTAIGNSGLQFFFRNDPTSYLESNEVVIDGNGAELIGDTATTTLNTKGETLHIVSNGVGWLILRRDWHRGWIENSPNSGSWTNTTEGTRTEWFRREGPDVHIKHLFSLVATPSASACYIQRIWPFVVSSDESQSLFAAGEFFGHVRLYDDNTLNTYQGMMRQFNSSNFELMYLNSSGILTDVTKTAPFTWVSGDQYYIEYSYQVLNWKG